MFQYPIWCKRDKKCAYAHSYIQLKKFELHYISQEFKELLSSDGDNCTFLEEGLPDDRIVRAFSGIDDKMTKKDVCSCF